MHIFGLNIHGNTTTRYKILALKHKSIHPYQSITISLINNVHIQMTQSKLQSSKTKLAKFQKMLMLTKVTQNYKPSQLQVQIIPHVATQTRALFAYAISE